MQCVCHAQPLWHRSQWSGNGEGFGIVYLEAALAGRASIACDQGGQSDFIVDGDTGWLIPPDANALKATLRELLHHPQEIQRRGALARARALQHFGQERFDQSLLQALEI